MHQSPLQFLTEVDRMVDQGAHQAAHEALDHLPAGYQQVAAVIRLRLLMMTETGDWESGLPLAKLIRPSHLPVIRRAAGKFYLAYAQALYQSGNQKAISPKLQKMQKVWPEGWCYVLAFLSAGSSYTRSNNTLALPA